MQVVREEESTEENNTEAATNYRDMLLSNQKNVSE